MGLLKPLVEMIVSEHLKRPINGDVGFIGKQTTYATEKSLSYFEKNYHISPPSDFVIEIDRETRSSSYKKSWKEPFVELFARRFHQTSFGIQLKHLRNWIYTFSPPTPKPKPNPNLSAGYITDRCLMKFLGAKSFAAIDVSAYEGADVICDLSQPIPKSLYGKFDFIFNGSCLDNLFNPGEALQNLSRMLRPGGRLMMIEHGSMVYGPYTVFSPGWFFDYFCYNTFAQCRIYYAVFKSCQELTFGPWPLYLYNWQSNKSGYSPRVSSNKHILYVIIAEKGPKSTDDFLPVQRQYRDKQFDETTFNRLAMEISKLDSSETRILKDREKEKPFLWQGYVGKNIPL